MNVELKSLLEKKETLRLSMQDYHTQNTETWNEENETAWTKMHDEMTSLESAINRAQLVAVDEAQKAEQVLATAEKTDKTPDEVLEGDEAYSKVFEKYIRGGVANLSNEERTFIQSRAQSAGTDTEGGFTVPQRFSNEITAALEEEGAVRSMARIWSNGTGNQIDWPVYDDTANDGALLAENTVDTEQDITFANKNLDAYKYTSKIIRVSKELLQDSHFDVQGLLMDAFAKRLGRITNQHYTTGTGSSQPNGYITAATVGVNAASATAVTFNELFDLYHAPDPAYRKSNSVFFSFNDGTLKAIRKLQDSENRYIWQGAVDSNNPGTILGKPYVVNVDMAAIAASAKSIAFGDMSYYVVRDVLPMTFVRLDERFADLHQVGFVAIMRTDGELMTNGTPIQVLQQASS